MLNHDGRCMGARSLEHAHIGMSVQSCRNPALLAPRLTQARLSPKGCHPPRVKKGQVGLQVPGLHKGPTWNASPLTGEEGHTATVPLHCFAGLPRVSLLPAPAVSLFVIWSQFSITLSINYHDKCLVLCGSPSIQLASGCSVFSGIESFDRNISKSATIV